MTWGPGKYDDLATLAREKSAADFVAVIVLNGTLGSGFSVQTVRPRFLDLVPGVLRQVADEIEQTGRGP